MIIRLGIDASQPLASCAVSADEGIVAELTMDRPIENFPALIRGTLERAGVAMKDVQEIAVCVGPGSQTGVRATVVTGNALALALGVRVVGVRSTDAAAVLAPEARTVAVSAGRCRWYVHDYEWRDHQLCRVGGMRLEEDVPEGVLPAFRPETEAQGPCARGVLLVAQDQPHLVVEATDGEVMPFEMG